jgi:hypothetical protein
MQTLTDVVATLRRKLPNPAAMAPITVRVALQTGIDLNNIGREQDLNPRIVMLVKTALKDLGYPVA